jgi:predicted porin
MKKSLFALAAVTAFAGAAQAQSSVTVYGILDMGYIGTNIKEVAATTGAVTKTQNSSFGQSAEASSRLGFRGTEDLGGGTRAFFTIEVGLSPQNPDLMSGSTSVDAFQRNTNNAGTGVNNRQSFLGLSQKGMGQAALGRQYTPVFDINALTNPGMNNNVIGNVIYPATSGPGASGGNGTGVAFTNRASNALTFQSDAFSGFRLGGMYAMSNINTTETSATVGGNNNWGGWGLKGDFTFKKFYLGAGYQSFKTNLANASNSAATVLDQGQGVNGGTVIVGATNNGNLFPESQIRDNQMIIATKYDFGILQAYASYVQRKINSDVAAAANPNGAVTTASFAGQQLNRTAQAIGVRGNFTPKILGWAQIGTGKYQGAMAAAGLPGSVNFVGFQLGTDYNLSKRTNLYAIYGQTQSSSGTTGTAGDGAGASQYALGVKHTF